MTHLPLENVFGWTCDGQHVCSTMSVHVCNLTVSVHYVAEDRSSLSRLCAEVGYNRKSAPRSSATLYMTSCALTLSGCSRARSLAHISVFFLSPDIDVHFLFLPLSYRVLGFFLFCGILNEIFAPWTSFLFLPVILSHTLLHLWYFWWFSGLHCLHYWWKYLICTMTTFLSIVVVFSHYYSNESYIQHRVLSVFIISVVSPHPSCNPLCFSGIFTC